MLVDFTKMSGAGNDFVVIDNRERLIKDGSLISQKLCNRQWGIGADGLLLVETSEKAAYKMMYYNADGSYGGMCGNGGRCIAHYAFIHAIASARHTFEALNHIYSAKIANNDVILQMKNPTSIDLNKKITVKRKNIVYNYINTGSPHIVINIKKFSKTSSLETLDLHHWGSLIRRHKKFQPEGANVNFIHRVDNSTIQLRTFERGVEAETLACGTGSIASAIIGSIEWAITPPITIIPQSNIPLTIDFEKNRKTIKDVTLKGPAVITFVGKIDV